MSGSGWNRAPLSPATPLFRLGRAEPPSPEGKAGIPPLCAEFREGESPIF